MISLLSVLMVLWIVNKEINPSYKLAWTILILGGSGVSASLFTFLFGQSRVAKKMTQESEAVVKEIANYFRESAGRPEKPFRRRKVWALPTSQRISENCAGFPVHSNTTTKYYAVGDDMFIDMLEDLKKAEHFIFLEYFIIHEGKNVECHLGRIRREGKAGSRCAPDL